MWLWRQEGIEVGQREQVPSFAEDPPSVDEPGRRDETVLLYVLFASAGLMTELRRTAAKRDDVHLLDVEDVVGLF